MKKIPWIRKTLREKEQIPQGHVSLFPLVRDQAGASGSLYTDSPSARIRLVEMLDADGWLGLEPVYRGGDVFLPAADASRLQEVLPLWLRAFGRTTGEKARLLLDHYGSPLLARTISWTLPSPPGPSLAGPPSGSWESS